MLVRFISRPKLDQDIVRQKMLAFAIALVALWTIAVYAHGQEDQFRQALDMAYTKQHPIVVFVGVDQRKITGAVSVQVYRLEGDDTPRVLVGKPGDRWMTRLPAKATDADILTVAFPKAVSREAAPFAESEGDSAAQLVPIIADLETYQRATMTQQTFRRWSGVINPFPRSRILAKWQRPGGLENVAGWSSRLYRTKGMSVRPFLTRQDPNDGNSAVTWWQNYPEGATFADVLRNDAGVVFEVRLAEKVDGRWERFVAYKNVSARPHGYSTPIRSECRACHAGAGLSEYGEAANPGADSVISHPIEPLESGRSVQGGYGERL